MEPIYSIIIPAYNEERWLPKTLTDIKQAMATIPLAAEIIVCDNNSTDATAAVAEQLGAKVVFEPYNQISRARNNGARQARGKYLIFVDADTSISSGLLQTALNNLQSGHCCGGGAIVALDGEITSVERLGLWWWNQLSMRLRVAAGCFVYCLREDFESIGGFSEAVYASEELWFSRCLHRLGKKRNMPFCIIKEFSALSSGRKAQWYSPGRQFLLLLLLLLFPFLVRYRRFCSFWYTRPENKPGDK
ncbi:MAG: glycosyltransferase [Gammaproteobacteria bacterium]|nr:glycosyltransferase [Gammaproteobacteria bacterium]